MHDTYEFSRCFIRRPRSFVDSREFAWYRLRNCAEQQVKSWMSKETAREFPLTTVESSFRCRHPVAKQVPSEMWKPSWCPLKFQSESAKERGGLKKFRELSSLRDSLSRVLNTRLFDFLRSPISRCSLPRVKCNDTRNRRARDLWSQLLWPDSCFD